MDDDLYCNLYVDTSDPALAEMVRSLTGGRLSRRTVNISDASIRVVRSEGADTTRAPRPENGFLHFGHYLDLDGEPDITHGAFVEALLPIVTGLRGAGIAVVPAGDLARTGIRRNPS